LYDPDGVNESRKNKVMDLITPREIATSENLARDQNLKNAIPTLKDSRKHHENTKITSSVVNCR